MGDDLGAAVVSLILVAVSLGGLLDRGTRRRRGFLRLGR